MYSTVGRHQEVAALQRIKRILRGIASWVKQRPGRLATR